jgi:hypothetical protein
MLKRLLLSAFFLWCCAALAQTPPSLDGTPVQTQTGGTAGSNTTAAFSTVGTSGVVVVPIFCNTPCAIASVTSTSSPTLTFSVRSAPCAGASRTVATYTAPYSSAISGTFTVTATTSTFIDLTVFAVKGVAASPFDPNGPVCNTTGGSTSGASMTTANNHDFVWCNEGLTGAGFVANAGWTAISGNAWFQGTVQQTTSVGGAFTCSNSAGTIDASTIDALTADGAGVVATSIHLLGTKRINDSQ